MDNQRKGVVNQSQFGCQGECVTSESEFCTWTNGHRTIDGASKGVQIFICLDVQRFEGYSIRDCST